MLVIGIAKLLADSLPVGIGRSIGCPVVQFIDLPLQLGSVGAARFNFRQFHLKLADLLIDLAWSLDHLFLLFQAVDNDRHRNLQSADPESERSYRAVNLFLYASFLRSFVFFPIRFGENGLLLVLVPKYLIIAVKHRI